MEIGTDSFTAVHFAIGSLNLGTVSLVGTHFVVGNSNREIGLFTGTNSILNALATASEDVLAQYLKENC